MSADDAGRSPDERGRELERYRTIVETVGDPMYVLDAEGHIEMANEAMAAQLGVAHDAVVGAHVSEFMPAADVRHGTELLRSLATDDDRRWASFEMDVLRPDGEKVRCEDRVAALTDESGRFVGSVGVLRDISARVSERERLRALTDKIEQLHGVATELQAASSSRTVSELVVDATDSILGFDWSIVALVRDGWFELTAVSEAAPVSVGDRHLRADEGVAGLAFQSGESQLNENMQDDETSDPVDDSFVAGLAVPLGDRGIFQAAAEQRGYFGDRDIELVELLAAHATEALRRIERENVLRERERELTRQNERLERFASAISHDLRNPLNLAGGHLDLAREATDEDDPAADHLAEVDWALGRIDRLVDDVLALARQGQAPDDTQPVALADAAAAAWATAGSDDAELVLSADPGVVEADEDRLIRLLENLFRNSVQHAGPAVRVVVGPMEAGFYVADDGPGIPPDERERVFESGYTTHEDGTGFGLAIVRELAAAHGWDVRLEASEAGGGAASGSSDDSPARSAGGARFEITGVRLVGER